ncbi:hypothetical protein [Aureimonas sp. D3]|uniref:hypothetical protein n=1 Tax=Aureimonas sp. D3 TaxID=1638164 RepID=UPI000785C009|nr:hypothetical protein [Aureimonas sp. D3]
MQKSLFATLAFVGAIGAASGAMAATDAHHIRQKADDPVVQKVATQPQVMTEKPIDHPTLLQVFGASDGVFYDPATNNPHTHGLPNF